MDKEKAKNYALRRLSMQALTTKQLRDAIIKKGAAASVADEVIAIMNRYGYLDDKAWAEGFFRGQIRKGVGPRLLRCKMREKGVPDSIAEKMVEKARKEQYKQIDIILKKKQPDLEDPKKRQKMAASLARKGFEANVIWDSLS